VTSIGNCVIRFGSLCSVLFPSIASVPFGLFRCFGPFRWLVPRDVRCVCSMALRSVQVFFFLSILIVVIIIIIIIIIIIVIILLLLLCNFNLICLIAGWLLSYYDVKDRFHLSFKWILDLENGLNKFESWNN
jgi:hypothetical protein